MEVEKGYLVAIAVALVVVASVIGAYFVLSPPANPGYNTIYLLDSQGRAANYPALLVVDQNSTLNVSVTVENHMIAEKSYQVQLKIVYDLSTFPVDAPAKSTYEKTLPSGGVWQTPITVNIDQAGNYSAVFELWILNPETHAYEFTDDFCVLHLQVVSQ
jgi:uncharacterized membrane protein